jgi:hypothetical protein
LTSLLLGSNNESTQIDQKRRLTIDDLTAWEKKKTLLLQVSKWFATFPPEPLRQQPVVVLLLEGALVSWSLALNERGGHEDLWGSDCRSVIPYVHGRTELYCSNVPCLSLPFRPSALTDLLRRGVYPVLL